jgi:hypothetical protein
MFMKMRPSNPLLLAFIIILARTVISLQAQNTGILSPAAPNLREMAYASDWRREQMLPAQVAFRSWTERYVAAPGGGTKAGLLSEGVALAKERHALLAGLIKNNPAKALALAVPASLRSRLPDGILAELESRVSGVGDYAVLGALSATNGPAVEPIRRFVHLNGRTYRASVYGRRLGETTKIGIPLHGIVLNGVMAVDENALRELEPDETPGPAQLVVDLRSAADQTTNQPEVFGEMGGRIYRFASTEQLQQVEAGLDVAESGIGPYPAQPATNLINRGLPSGSSRSTNLPIPPSAWTTGGKNVLIIRVDFSDKPGAPYSAATIQSLADTQISPYYLKSSYQLTSLTNTVSSLVYRMPQTAAYYATNDANDQLHSDAGTAASANFTLANYDRIIVVFSSLGSISGSQITYGGLAQVGGPNVWCNGEFDFRVIAHELGHTYGLYHANLWQVSDGNPISPSGSDVEYGDDFDTMGANYANNQSTDFNPWFKNDLGWLADTQVMNVTTSGTYRIYAFDHDNYLAAPGETLGLKIVKNGATNYWLGCRVDFTNNASMTNGVYVIWGYNYNRQSDLLDMTTPGSSDQDAGLAVGAVFNDPTAAITIHPLARTLPPLAPTISREPANQTVLLGNVAAFSVAAGGNPAPVFQWQRKPNGSSAWIVLSDGGNYSGSGASNLTVNVADLAMSGDQFRCVATNTVGSVTSSPPATLTVNSGLVITTLAGQAGIGGNADGTGTNAQFYYPYDVAAGPDGNVYVADYYYGMVRKLTPQGVVTTLATGFYGPQGVAVDSGTNVYVADTSDQVIQKITPAGAVIVIAGSFSITGTNDGTSALFNHPWGIAVDSATNVYVADSGNSTIRKITSVGANWVVTTIAGLAGSPGSSDGTNSNARFCNPGSLAVDAAGNIYVADTSSNIIRKITLDGTGTNWMVTTIAGLAGVSGSRDGRGVDPQSSAQFYSPSGIAVDGNGNVYVADTYNDLIRKITSQGAVSTLAGQYFVTGSADGFYTNAQFNFPYGVAVDNAANVYVADTFNHTIRVGRLASVTIPKLAVMLSNHVATVSWPVPTQHFTLQSSTNLLQTNWTSVTLLPAFLNGQNYVTNPASGGSMFFRLKNP